MNKDATEIKEEIRIKWPQFLVDKLDKARVPFDCSRQDYLKLLFIGFGQVEADIIARHALGGQRTNLDMTHDKGELQTAELPYKLTTGDVL